MRAAEDEMLAALAKFVVQIFKSVETGGIHRENFSHAKNKDLRVLAGTLERGFEFVGGAEEKCAKDAEDKNAVGNLLADE